MRVLLINPFYPIGETPSPPLGLAYLAGALEAAGIEVRVLDLVVTPGGARRLETLLAEFAPQAVGLTAVTMNVDRALSLAAAIKRLDPAALTVLGGPHASFCAEKTLAACPALDVVVRGEGEETLVELCRAIERRRPLSSVRGITVREGDGFRSTPDRPFLADLDRLPLPARHLLPLGRYRALGLSVSMTTSRGCPHRCIFCVGRRMVGPRVRLHGVRRVVDELAELSALGFPQVNLADDWFTADARRCRAVCDEILARGLNIRWTSFARVDSVSEALLCRMKAAGCAAVSFGLESANRGILRTAKKGITPEQARAAVEACRRAGVTAMASFILGLPGETPETLAETLAFGEELAARGLQYGFHLLAPFPGTEVRERSAALGLRILTDDWSRYDANRAVCETEAAPAALLETVARDWEGRFQKYLAEIGRRRDEGKAGEQERRTLENLERIVLLYELMMGEAVEGAGSWELPDGGDPLAGLLERVGSSFAGDRNKLAAALSSAFGRGDLECVREGRAVRFRWRESLAAAKGPRTGA
ncbi:MAG: radical SAM protein [Desulfobacterales bacterium]